MEFRFKLLLLLEISDVREDEEIPSDGLDDVDEEVDADDVDNLVLVEASEEVSKVGDEDSNAKAPEEVISELEDVEVDASELLTDVEDGFEIDKVFEDDLCPALLDSFLKDSPLGDVVLELCDFSCLFCV